MKFAATFQQRYRDDEHPRLPLVTHRSYLLVEAPNETKARIALNYATTGEADELGDYAFIYPYDNDFIAQEHRWDLEPLPYIISPTSCACGGQYAFMVKRPSGAFEMKGCVCHTDLKEVLHDSVD